MKAQKIGFVLGLNVAAACLMMQGCKATKAVDGSDTADQAVVVEQQASAKPKKSYHFFEKKNASETVQPTTVATVEPAPVAPVAATVTPIVSEPVPPAPTVKPISATPAPKAATVAAVPATPAPAATTYTIQKGDTLSGISKRYNVKMSAILAANPGLKADKIRIGKKINVPGTGTAAVAAVPAKAEKKAAPTMMAAAPAPAAEAANLKAPTKTKPAFKPYEGATKEYVVKNGDSLGKIASENGITIRALKELNSLKKDMVRVGQKIKIPAEKVVAAAPAPAAEAPKAAAPAPKAVAPAPAPKAEAPVVAPAAAPAPKAEAPAAVEAPKAEAPAAVEAPKVEAPVAAEAPKAEEPATGATHVVKEGEDLVSIAIQYAVSPSALMEINNLKVTDTPKAGQVLKLPASATKSAQ